MALERLAPVEMLPLTHSDDQQRTRLRITDGMSAKDGDITAQTADGRVYVRFDGQAEPTVVDLTRVSYEWL